MFSLTIRTIIPFTIDWSHIFVDGFSLCEVEQDLFAEYLIYDPLLPSVVILPGLEGHSRRPYVQNIAKWFKNKKWNIFLFNYRGGFPGSRPAVNHAGQVEDLEKVLSFFASKFQLKEFYIVGFSIGGSLALNFLKYSPQNKIVKKTVVISAPINFENASTNIEKNIILKRILLFTLNKKLFYLAGKKFSKFKMFEEFSIKLNGFSSISEYYNKHSPHLFLNKIESCILIINSKNDPIISDLCLKSITESSHAFKLYNRGGHIYVTKKMNEVWRLAFDFFLSTH